MKGFSGEDFGVNIIRGAQAASDGVANVMRGGEGGQDFGVNIIRGGQKAAKSVDELTQKILNNSARFKDNSQAIQSVLQDLAKLRKQDAAIGTAVGVQLLGKRYALFAEALDRLGKGQAWADVKKQLQEQGRLPSDESMRRVEQYNQAVDAVGDSLEKLKLAIAIPLFPQISGGINQLATLIENFDQLKAKYEEFRNLAGLSAIEEAIAGPIRRGLTSALDAVRAFADNMPGPISASFRILADLLQVTVNLITGDLSGAITAFSTLSVDVWTTVTGLVTTFGDTVKATIAGLTPSFTWLWDQIKAASSAITGLFGSAPPAATAPIPPASGLAAGGRVPGSGSGDTVPAWLTPGEFVVRKAAVARYGAGLFHALNAQRFANGGSVDGANNASELVKLFNFEIETLNDNQKMLDRAVARLSYTVDIVNGNMAELAKSLGNLTGLKEAVFARGGFVPGSGNGDTVPAWLSPGEYVVRKSAVQRYGMGLFHALNAERYALGGLVDSLHTPRGFADGGLVAATAGTPVHLHLGGQTFALSGGADVVSSLAHEARRYALRSAGTKPSWYGGTPGGR